MGPALARGYVGRVELTAGTVRALRRRLRGAHYRTGDLVRWTPAGNAGLWLLQLKLRGQRIELGEIENTLLACPQVTRAAAAGNTGAHLIGYITLEHTSSADPPHAEIVEEWQHVYDELYGAEVAVLGVWDGFSRLEQQLHR